MAAHADVEDPMLATAFGHPRGLAVLAFTETWERFSFLGMKALLVLYMVSQLLLPGHIEHVAGFSAFKASAPPASRGRAARARS